MAKTSSIRILSHLFHCLSHFGLLTAVAESIVAVAVAGEVVEFVVVAAAEFVVVVLLAVVAVMTIVFFSVIHSSIVRCRNIYLDLWLLWLLNDWLLCNVTCLWRMRLFRLKSR